MANPTSNFGWQMPTNTDLVKDLPADFEVFGQAVDTSLMDLKGGTTGQVLSKASNTDMDFTWVTDATGIPATIFDAKGDIIAATAADSAARLASSGNNGDLLTVDTSTATGLKWAAPAASGGMTLIQETVASGLSSLSFSSIPSTYKHLYLTWSGVYHSATGSGFNIRFNNDSTDIYSMRYCTLESGVFSNSGTNGGTMVQNNSNFAPFGLDTTSSTLNNAARGFLFIENYASTSKYKNYNGEYFLNVAGVGFRSVFNHLGLYYTTTAITSVDIYRTTGSATFSNATNTSIRLYGVS
jgi:hypothetical protein